MSFPVAEADRRIANVISVGVVTGIDAAAVRARVRIGALETAMVPVTQMRAGRFRFHAMPAVGEQVVVLAPDGDYARAVVSASITAGNAPGSDGDHITIDMGGGEARITGTLVIEGDVRITGRVTVSEDVVAAGISLVEHRHPHGDPAGITGEPQ